MKYLFLLLPLTLIAQERRLSVNWVTGIAGNYSWGRLNRPTLQTSWRMVQGYNGHDSMFGWDNWGVKGEYSYCRTDYHRNQNDYWMVTFDYYVNNTGGCVLGAAIEGLEYTQDSGKTWIKQAINITPDTMVYYQSKSGDKTTCICPLELNCWHNSIKWHRFTFDHVIPKSKGGKDSINNLMPAHRGCNSKRGDREIHNSN